MAKKDEDRDTCVHQESTKTWDQQEAWGESSLISARAGLAHIYGKMAGRGRNLGRRTGRCAGDQEAMCAGRRVRM